MKRAIYILVGQTGLASVKVYIGHVSYATHPMPIADARQEAARIQPMYPLLPTIEKQLKGD